MIANKKALPFAEFQAISQRPSKRERGTVGITIPVDINPVIVGGGSKANNGSRPSRIRWHYFTTRL